MYIFLVHVSHFMYHYKLCSEWFIIKEAGYELIMSVRGVHPGEQDRYVSVSESESNTS